MNVPHMYLLQMKKINKVKCIALKQINALNIF